MTITVSLHTGKMISRNRDKTKGVKRFPMSSQTQSQESRPARSTLRRLDTLSRVLDTALPIPGTGRRIGLDGLLGFIPGVGDTLGAACSSYIIFEAARLGASKRTLLRMLGNVAIEIAVGIIPIVGDVFDIVWQANVRNMDLLRANTEELHNSKRSSDQIAYFFLAVALAVLIGLGLLSVVLLRALYQLVTA